MELQWWIWLVLGFGLILLELVLPTFFIIWFGIGAIAVGIIAGLVPGLSLASELVICSGAI